MRFSVLSMLTSTLNFSSRFARSNPSFSRLAQQSSRDYGSLISAKEAVQAAKLDKKVKFVDATWYLDKTRSGCKEYLERRIPSAQYFDIDAIADKTNPLPHMLPNESQFAQAMSDMGISSTDHVVVYTNKEAFSGPRVWWTLRTFGHKNVSLLQGGLQAWEDEGKGYIETGPVSPVTNKGVFTAKLNKKMVMNAKQVLEIVMTGSKQLLDARSQARFLGTAPEPRPELAGGHIPGSLNLPATELLQGNDFSRFKSPLEIKKAFLEAGIILGSDITLTCGSGVTAAVLYFGLHMLGQETDRLSIYDGSWTEWGSRPDLPVYNPAKDN